MNMYYGKSVCFRNLLFFAILFFAFSMNVSAIKYGGCEYSDVARLKKAVTNINLSYKHHITNSGITYDVTVSNLIPNLYFVDLRSGIEYHYADTNFGEITIYNYYGYNGIYEFHSEIRECYGLDVGKKYYSFPSFNYYSIDPLCDGIEEFSLCQRWAVINYDSSTFKREIYKYRYLYFDDTNEDKDMVYERGFFDTAIEFYLNNYIYIFAIIIVVGGASILIIKKTNKFKM